MPCTGACGLLHGASPPPDLFACRRVSPRLEEYVAHDRRPEDFFVPGARRYYHDVTGVHHHTLSACNGATVKFSGSDLPDIGRAVPVIEQDITLLDHKLLIPAHVLFDVA